MLTHDPHIDARLVKSTPKLGLDERAPMDGELKLKVGLEILLGTRSASRVRRQVVLQEMILLKRGTPSGDVRTYTMETHGLLR